MAEAFVNVNEGASKKLHAWDRVIGANTVLDEFTLPGEYPLPTYTVRASGVSTATVNDHLIQLMAGASLNVRIRKITVRQAAAAGAVAAGVLELLRLTTAGTGGTAVTPGRRNNADAAAGAAGMTLPTAKGTESTILDDWAYWFGTTAIPVRDHGTVLYQEEENVQPIIIPAGTTNGIAIKSLVAVATVTVSIVVEFVETSFV